jgi:signal transduction histidine kinase
VSFLDRLSEYLRDVAPHPGRPRVSAVPAIIDPAFARTALIRALERLEQEPNPERLLLMWQQDDRVVRFSRRMAQLLRESFGVNASQEEMESWLELAIARRVGLGDVLPSRIRTLEIDRLAEMAWSDSLVQPGDRFDIAAYAAAIRATRRVGTVLALTPIGRVFLELTGRDAIRWLLHVEVALSFGPFDPWRLSRESAIALVRKTSWSFSWEQVPEDVPHTETIRRLETLGLVSSFDDEGGQWTELNTLPVGEVLLSEIAKQEESPMSVLAGSLISDLTLSAADAAAGRLAESSSDVQASAVAEATARQSRLVAHEIRNMLVPVKTALGAFYREVLMAEQPGDVVARRSPGIDRGIDSVFRFIDQLVELARFAATPPEALELLPAIRDAISAVEMESGRQVEQVLPATLPPVSGHRARVVMALTNVLRNAVQAVPSQSPVIRIQAESIEGASAVRISVEDNGPGVPETMRRAIFDEGISLRGGSGLGLALVREVFEKEMKGLVACDASPLGGARFVMRIPTTGMERP